MPTQSQTGHVLTIEREFAAPRELVFKAWTSAAMAKNWWGCNEFPASHMEMDARPGGRWRGCLKADDGNEIWLGGKFIEVVPSERLVFTFVRDAAPGIGIESVDTRVTVLLTEHGRGTRMSFRQEFFVSPELCDNHRLGWTTGFARLDQIFAGQQGK